MNWRVWMGGTPSKNWQINQQFRVGEMVLHNPFDFVKVITGLTCGGERDFLRWACSGQGTEPEREVHIGETRKNLSTDSDVGWWQESSGKLCTKEACKAWVRLPLKLNAVNIWILCPASGMKMNNKPEEKQASGKNVLVGGTDRPVNKAQVYSGAECVQTPGREPHTKHNSSSITNFNSGDRKVAFGNAQDEPSWLPANGTQMQVY
ncbi:hypothetical protein DFH09DRAFT_1093845 [Mycena vulgaris]|nr:hypothetical protein DFH09DRAFT_1093845 [Mycena vulgaris]